MLFINAFLVIPWNNPVMLAKLPVFAISSSANPCATLFQQHSWKRRIHRLLLLSWKRLILYIMQALNTLRWCCTSRGYQNANAVGKYIVNILSTSSNAVLYADLALHNEYRTGTRGFCNTTSELLGRFNVNQAAVYPNQSRTFSTVSKRCWKCESAIQVAPVFFCPTCKVIQAPDEHATYFDIMDW